MKEYRAKLSSRFGQPDIVVFLDPATPLGFDWLSAYFESEAAKGVIFRSNETLQIGWMTLTLR